MHLPIIIDIETSGFGSGSYPIEIGWVESNGTSHCHLIEPLPNWTHWDETAQAVHGIDRTILAQAGKPPIIVAEHLNRRLQGKTVYSDAWSHDMCWLGILFEATDITQRFRIESIVTLLTEQEQDSWSDLLNRTREEQQLTRHRASADALVIQKCFGTIIKKRAKSDRLTG